MKPLSKALFHEVTSCECRVRSGARRRGPRRSGARGAALAAASSSRLSGSSTSRGDDLLDLAPPPEPPAARRATNASACSEAVRSTSCWCSSRSRSAAILRAAISRVASSPSGRTPPPRRSGSAAPAEERPQLGEQRLALASGPALDLRRPGARTRAPVGRRRSGAGLRSARRSPAARPPAGPVRIGDPAGVEHLEEQIEHLGVGLVDLVQQHHGVRVRRSGSVNWPSSSWPT